MSPRPLVLVTGGSRGIGAATCRAAARAGYDVGVNYRGERGAAEAVAADCRAAGARAAVFQGDMAEPQDVARLFGEVDGALGRVTHLVNNAGVIGRAGPLADAEPAMIAACVALNVTGALLVAREGVRRISTRHGGAGGAIVNLSSAASWLGAPGEFVWYAATKGAVDSLTLGLAREVAGEGVRVNAVAPGIIDTEIHASGGDAGRVARVGPLTPIGRAGTAEEVAATILFLLSDAAAYVTGTVVRVTGGR